MAALRHNIRSLADLTASHGLSPGSLSICLLLDGIRERPGVERFAAENQLAYLVELDEGTKKAAREIEDMISQHTDVVEWQSNEDVLRVMRRDIKRELRPTDDYTEIQLDERADRIVELARRGGHAE